MYVVIGFGNSIVGIKTKSETKVTIESEKTVRAVCCQENFPSAVHDVVERMLSIRVVGVYCKTGFHRSATVAEAATSLLCYTGHEALHLAVAADLAGDLRWSVHTACKWADGPWAPPTEFQWRSFKAKTVSRPEAWGNACVLEVVEFTNLSLHYLC